jgi:hypothetical protein
MQIPESFEIDANSITDFNNKNQATFKEIERFILEVNDWVTEKQEELKANEHSQPAKE